MHDNTTLLSNLVTDLDDAHLFCTDASERMARAWLMRLLSELAQFHHRIADELCVSITTTPGRRIVRLARPRQGWRNAWSQWLHTHTDSDLAYLEQARKREERLTRQFIRAVRRIPGGDTHWRLERDLYKIDHARMNLTRVVAGVEGEVARRFEAGGSARITVPAAAPQTVVQERTHVKA